MVLLGSGVEGGAVLLESGEGGGEGGVGPGVEDGALLTSGAMSNGAAGAN